MLLRIGAGRGGGGGGGGGGDVDALVPSLSLAVPSN